LPDQNIINAVAIHSPQYIGFIGVEWNFQDRDRGKEYSPRVRQLMMAMFNDIEIFHGE
jgi:hypothetical protein